MLLIVCVHFSCLTTRSIVIDQVMRIVGVEGGDPYDVVGVNHKMSIENIKKR